MAYTVTNFKTKKALKEAVRLYNISTQIKGTELRPLEQGIKCYQPGLGPDLSNYTGKVYLEGPHYPAAHTWYAEAELVNGVVVKVK